MKKETALLVALEAAFRPYHVIETGEPILRERKSNKSPERLDKAIEKRKRKQERNLKLKP